MLEVGIIAGASPATPAGSFPEENVVARSSPLVPEGSGLPPSAYRRSPHRIGGGVKLGAQKSGAIE